MSRWLITGGAGFIGSHLAERLVQRGEQVRVLDNLSTGDIRNLSTVRKKIELVKGDIRVSKDVRKAVRGVDYVLHQAALRSVVRSLENPILSNDVNANGTLMVLWESLRAGVKRVVYASSSSVYGDSKIFPQSPTQNPKPISPYAVSKLTGEYYAVMFAKTLGLSTVSLRYFNVFGPRQDPRSKYAVVIPIFMKAAYENKSIPLEGDGNQSRDFTYIDNVVDANLLAATRHGISGEVFNVACGENHSLMDYLCILENTIKKKVKIKFGKGRIGDVRKTWADISASKSKLGYKPAVNFSDGVEKTWTSFVAEER